MFEEALKDATTVVPTECEFTHAFRVRHESENVAPWAAVDSCDVMQRTIGIVRIAKFTACGRVAQPDEALSLEALEDLRRRVVATLSVRDRQTPNAVDAASERALGFDAHMNVAALKTKMRVAGQRAVEKADLGENLKTVAHSEHKAAACSVPFDGLKNRTRSCEGAASQVIAVREAARNHDEVKARLETRFGMPNGGRLEPAHASKGVDHLVIGVRARKDHHRSAHDSRGYHKRPAISARDWSPNDIGDTPANMVQPLPNDPPVTEALLRSHKISASEYERILGALGREPTFTELGVFSVMWSEHCSYKSSRLHLRRLPTKGPKVIQGPGENAGVVDIGDGLAAVFKMESHNHPSFIEPHQGAATGVGGIMRDVFTMGARPIASLNSLRFGRPDHPRTPELLRGVVEGIGGYGNCIGVPTVGGEVQFDARYDGNILVNAFTCGIARTDRIFYGRATGVGYSILYIGAKTGRDGIHGATMASDEFSNEGPSQRPTMQVGDPFMGKLLLEACLELFAQDILEGIQDMGAAGLTSSSVEMASRAKNGIEIDLDKVPRRARNMQPYELLLSESQERMLLVAKPGKEDHVLEICKKWELDAAIIGTVTSTGRWVVRATPDFDPLDPRGASADPLVVADIPIDALTDDAPVYDRPCADRPAPSLLGAMPAFLEGRDLVATILAHVASPNLGSRQWIWRQFDSIVRGGTLVGPGSDAAVVHVRAEGKDNKVYDKWLAFAVDCNGRYCELDPREGAKMAVAEVCRNLVCSGAEPIGITDCLNFGNPEKPNVMTSFRDAIDGLAEACVALDVPIVSGNVSLYNETDGQAILPTPSVAAVGQIDKPEHITRAFFRPGQSDTILVLGEHTTALHFAGSEYACSRVGLRGKLQPIDLEFEKRLQRLVRTLIVQQLVESAHDVSDGGLVNALAESCCGSAKSSVGAMVSLPFAGEALEAALFAEGPSRIIVSVRDENVSRLSDLARDAAVPVQVIGKVSGDEFSISSGAEVWSVPLSDLRSAREGCLTPIVGEP